MKQSKFIVIIVSFVLIISVALGAFILYYNDDSRIPAISAYEELNLSKLYEEGEFLTTEGELKGSEDGFLVGVVDKDTYIVELGYLDFGDKCADKIIINLVTKKTSDTMLKMYVDSDEKPFLEISVREQNVESDDEDSEENIYNISGVKLKGKHKIRLEISGDKDTEFEIRNIEFKTADIPTLYFNLDEQYGTIEAMNQNKNNSCTGELLISIPDGYKAEYTDSKLENLECHVETIHGRGNSTWDCDKKPYIMKLSEKEELFGMESSKKWVLLANYYDKSLMRDKLAYNLSYDMGMEYTPQSVFVDIVMNDKYVGSYLLTEKIEVKESRVNIQDLDNYPNETDENIINGGYLIQLKPYERVQTDEMYFRANYNDKAVVIESPSFDLGYNSAQYNYIKDYYHSFEEAVYSSDFCNSEGVRYTELIDVDSFVDFYLVHEIFKNNDALYASTFFYKDKDSKMCIGPVWDLDLSAGTYSCNFTEFPQGFFINGQYIFERLMKDPEFSHKVVERYVEIHDYVVKMYSGKDDTETSDIEKYANVLDISQKMNFDKWGMGNRGWNAILGQGSYEAEVDYLENWLKERVEWLDNNIKSLEN